MKMDIRLIAKRDDRRIKGSYKVIRDKKGYKEGFKGGN